MFFPGDTMLVRPSSMIARKRALADRMLQKTDQHLQQQQKGGGFLSYSSPRYELVDDETKFQLSVDVPGIKMEDIDISLDDGYLTVRGQRVASDDHSKFMSKFSQTFLVDPAVDIDKFSATLDHGVLTVTAPKDMKKLEENVRKIPIISTTTKNDAASAAAKAPSMSVSASTSAASDEDTIDLDGMDDNEKTSDNVNAKVDVKIKNDDVSE